MFGYKHVVTQVFTTVLTCNCSSHYYSVTNSAYNKQVIQILQINISIWATAHLPLPSPNPTLTHPESDQYLISPYSNTAESFIKITRVKEMIDCQLIKEALIARQILLVSTKGNV